MIKNKIKNNKGFVILFAVVLSSIILAVALNIVDILLKEVKFSSSAKDTNDAFFAADTGAECALFNDKSGSVSFMLIIKDGGSGVVNCLNADIPIPLYCLDDGTTGNKDCPSLRWFFTITGLNSSGKGCAKVSVDKSNPLTNVISKGYNDCMGTSNKVERVLELNY